MVTVLDITSSVVVATTELRTVVMVGFAIVIITELVAVLLALGLGVVSAVSETLVLYSGALTTFVS